MYLKLLVACSFLKFNFKMKSCCVQGRGQKPLNGKIISKRKTETFIFLFVLLFAQVSDLWERGAYQ